MEKIEFQQKNKILLKLIITTILLILFIGSVSSIPFLFKQENKITTSIGIIEEPKNVTKSNNVILIIPDGFGVASQTLAREYEGVDFLTLDQIQKGTCHTNSASSPITDSAAAGTALACGLKTYNGRIAIDTNGNPCVTLIEKAMDNSMATGIVVKSRITHATPASFSSHQLDRNQELDIAVQQLNSAFGKIDILFGGGRDMFIPTSLGGKRTDGRNLETEAESKGYTVIHTTNELNQTNLQTPILGLFTSDNYPYVIDRQNLTDFPTLQQTSQKALELLSQKAQEEDINGFFLLIECSLIDYCGHQNDPAAQVRETLQCNQVVKQMMDFIDSDSNENNTLLVVVADHETGGLYLDTSLEEIYKSQLTYVWNPDILKPITKSAYSMTDLVYYNGYSVEDVLSDFAQISNLTQSELDELNAALNSHSFDQLNYALSDVISQRAQVGWTTHGHTGVDVIVYSYGNDSNSFVGSMDNTDIPKKIDQFLQFESLESQKILENSEISFYSSDSPKINDSFHS
ncbi:alkaline phosphatase-related [Anaeramoeba ignava]|uniref:Alkaline phosphatase n=1 Tax=Anaeramoeba ignava TaxID=1746090 RepID=A0A9Q0LI95_ANAIG|nr:alkaline phosphatase-related [Anaeramoeba ignava]